MSRGFSLLEILIGTAILGLLGVAGWGLSRTVLSFNATAYDSLSAQADVLKIVNAWAGEIRSASTAENGAYPVVSASTGTFAFYSDVDDDGVVERVRYFVSGDKIRKGVIKPVGSPPVYDTGAETVIDQVRDVTGSATAVFQYYDSSYDGSTPPLPQPVEVSDVRLVKITVAIDRDPLRPPGPIEVTTQVGMRNLKDNL